MSRSRKSRRRELQASHQKNWLVGKHAVVETLKANRWPVLEVFLQEGAELDESVADQANTVTVVSADRLTQLCHSQHHQGMAARMGDFPYRDVNWLQKQLTTTDRSAPLIVMCDRIQDAHNFGAILRCCDATNVTAIIIGSINQAAVTPQVSRSSAGAVNHLEVVACDDLLDVAKMIEASGIELAAASEKAQSPVWTCDLRKAVCLIIGSEAFGVDSELLATCNHQLGIPMLGQIDSLNAAVAAGILLYEIRRQQTQQSQL